MIPLYPTPIPPMRQETYESQTPLIPPAPRSRSNDSGYHSSGRQPSKTRHVGRQQRLAENLAPASAYNSALPDFQNKKPLKSHQKRSSSDLPYAYDGVTSVMSSQPPPADTRRPPEMEGRKKSSRTPKPPAHRQDSDQPLKSAMRAPGDRKPRRKATITEKPPTTRMITNRSAYDSGGQDDWLPKPPVISEARAPRQSISETSSRGESLLIPHPSKRPVIPRGGLAPAPASRAFARSRTDSDHRPQSIGKRLLVVLPVLEPVVELEAEINKDRVNGEDGTEVEEWVTSTSPYQVRVNVSTSIHRDESRVVIRDLP
jgi:hypothetical protein